MTPKEQQDSTISTFTPDPSTIEVLRKLYKSKDHTFAESKNGHIVTMAVMSGLLGVDKSMETMFSLLTSMTFTTAKLQQQLDELQSNQQSISE